MVISKLINTYRIINVSIVTSRLDWNHFKECRTDLPREAEAMGQIAAERGP